jgi:hypothetical protein
MEKNGLLHVQRRKKAADYDFGKCSMISACDMKTREVFHRLLCRPYSSFSSTPSLVLNEHFVTNKSSFDGGTARQSTAPNRSGLKCNVAGM